MNSKNPKSSGIEVSIDSEKLVATVRIDPGPGFTFDGVLEEMKRAGVVYGIAAESIHLALQRRGQRIAVAQGIPSVEGCAGHIECICLDDLTSAQFTPIEDDHGKVDCHGGHVRQTVKPGDVLARIVPSVPPVTGRRVTGEEITPAHPLDVTPVLGSGVKLSADRTQILASTTGLPNIQGARFAVVTRCEVKNVDFTTGDVYFVGSVTVSGDVLPGFAVVATEDIWVKGGVEHGTLRAGGTIAVGGGISHSSELDAIGDVAVRFVEPGCKVTSRGTIHVRDNALRSELSGRQIVIGHQFVAGRAMASELISAGILGNESETVTYVELARAPSLCEKRRAELAKQRAVESLELERLRKSLQDAGRNAVLLKKLVPQTVSRELKVRHMDHVASVGFGEPREDSGSIVALAKTFRGVKAILYGHEQLIAGKGGKTTLCLVDGKVAVT